MESLIKIAQKAMVKKKINAQTGINNFIMHVTSACLKH